MAGKSTDQYSDEEAQRRFEAALRGAREVGHEPMKDISPKRLTPCNEMNLDRKKQVVESRKSESNRRNKKSGRRPPKIGTY